MNKFFILFIVNCARVAHLALLLIPSTRDCCGQSISWQRVYENPIINGDDEAFDLCPADGSNFYVVGSSASFDPYFYVLKVNQYGDTIWTRTFGQGGRALAVAPSQDGGCVFTGLWGSAFSIKVSAIGDTIWNKAYNGPEGQDIIRTADTGYILCGSRFVGYICKIDSLGNLQWERTYAGSTIEFSFIDFAVDWGYIVAGQKLDSGSFKSYLLKIDGAGNIIWEKTYASGFLVNSVAKTNSAYVVATNTRVNNQLRIVILKTDINGNQIACDTLNNNSIEDYEPSIVGINNNKFHISFNINLTPSVKGNKIITIDSNLNVTKQLLLLPDTNDQFIHSILRAPGQNSNDIISVGSTAPQYPNDEDVYLVRLDSSLTQPPPISVIKNTHILPQQNLLFQNFPNPFNHTTTIQIGISENAYVTVTVYDILGRQLMILFEEQMKPGFYSRQLNTTNWSSGVYLYQLSVNGLIVQTNKLVLIK